MDLEQWKWCQPECDELLPLSQEPGAHGLPVLPLALEGAVEADASSVEVELLGVMVHEPEICFVI